MLEKQHAPLAPEKTPRHFEKAPRKRLGPLKKPLRNQVSCVELRASALATLVHNKRGCELLGHGDVLFDKSAMAWYLRCLNSLFCMHA